MNQHQVPIIVVVIALVAIVGIAGFLLMRKRRSQMLREHFGPEYDRVIKREGNLRKGEAVLVFRTERRKNLKITPLSPSIRSDFSRRWTAVQAQFVDDPKGAVVRADDLVSAVMQARGYLAGEFDQRVADLSVDYPVVVDNYRAAHEVALRHGRGQASTEDLRKAMVHYRALFDELLENSFANRKDARDEHAIEKG